MTKGTKPKGARTVYKVQSESASSIVGTIVRMNW